VIRAENTANFGFEDNPADQRAISDKQNIAFQTKKTGSTTKITQNKPLQPLFWIAALLIFVTERILSFRKKPNNVKN